MPVFEMSDGQRDKAFALLRESLSGEGFQTARDVMRLNETVLEMTGRLAEYGEDLYWLSMMGTPSPTEPWGWQIDGHHLNINFFVLGDQVVMTPTFLGSEPVFAQSGRYAAGNTQRTRITMTTAATAKASNASPTALVCGIAAITECTCTPSRTNTSPLKA